MGHIIDFLLDIVAPLLEFFWPDDSPRMNGKTALLIILIVLMIAATIMVIFLK